MYGSKKTQIFQNLILALSKIDISAIRPREYLIARAQFVVYATVGVLYFILCLLVRHS